MKIISIIPESTPLPQSALLKALPMSLTKPSSFDYGPHLSFLPVLTLFFLSSTIQHYPELLAGQSFDKPPDLTSWGFSCSSFIELFSSPIKPSAHESILTHSFKVTLRHQTWHCSRRHFHGRQNWVPFLQAALWCISNKHYRTVVATWRPADSTTASSDSRLLDPASVCNSCLCLYNELHRTVPTILGNGRLFPLLVFAGIAQCVQELGGLQPLSNSH